MGISITDAWQELFEKHKILDIIKSKGTFTITSKEINTVKEARLMSKFDQTVLLPDIF